MDSYTKTGLLFLIIGLIFGVIVNISISVSALFDGGISTILFFIISGLIGGLGGLFVLIGGLLIIIGRKEFGEKHQKYTIYAIFVLILNIIVIFFLSVFSLFLRNSNYSIYVFIISIINAAIGGLIYIFLLIELEDQKGKSILYCSYIISIIITTIIGIYTTLLPGGISEFFSLDNNYQAMMSNISNISVMNILNVITSLFLILASYLPFKRIQSGDLVPKPIDQFKINSVAVPDRICPNCGRPIPIDAKWCSYCGKKFDL